MPPGICRYCGMVWYFSNSACQAAASSGGMVPVTGFHSTIDNPDSVSRVAPPTTTIRKISPATASSQTRMIELRDRDCLPNMRPGPYRPRGGAAIGSTMGIRTRKLIGAVALLVLVTVWALVAMGLGQAPTIRENRLLAGL